MVDENTIPDLSSFLGGRSFEQAWGQYDRDGYIIFENIMPAHEVARVRSVVEPHLNKTGRNNFEGYKSNRVYSLLAKAPDVFSDMVTHPLALAFAERELGTSCLLSALLAINLHPGETVQGWHCDDDQILVPRPRAPFGVSAFWAIDEMNELNGATEILPGSHTWDEHQKLPLPFGAEAESADKYGVDYDPLPHADSIKATMPSGSLMIAKGTLYHRGGANKSENSRLIVTPQYCSGWARQLENMVLSVPQDIARKLPKRTRELIGYNIHAAFMGYVDGMHPDRVLGIGS